MGKGAGRAPSPRLGRSCGGTESNVMDYGVFVKILGSIHGKEGRKGSGPRWKDGAGGLTGKQGEIVPRSFGHSYSIQ